ncbi:hypothetical protein HPB52_005902 [Rhipicephalus sanguineus]|uniref:Ubiquitin-like domain-containing protein n=1 Tax=Rhipicephalus sanguineus TaxID=34632 RepID=A0A9D4PLY3_RHISA|nr:hypothetical protein HPB52_005902 [Rhipicephalus sanguineus]
MKIIIQCQESHAVEVTGDETVAFLKSYLHTTEGIVPEDQRLYAEGGKPLNDGDLLSACLTDGALVNAVVPLVGALVELLEMQFFESKLGTFHLAKEDEDPVVQIEGGFSQHD